MTPKIWAKYAWLFHLCGVVFIAGVSWAGVAAQAARIDTLEKDYKDVPSALARIEQKVDDMHDNVFRNNPR